MNSAILIECIGYLGSILVAVSMLLTSVKRLRIVNTIGSVIFTTYAIIIHTYPTALLNAFLIVVNIYHLVKIEQNEKNYVAIGCYKDESIVQLYLKTNLEDIRKYFPSFTPEGGHLSSYIVFSDARPIGIMVGQLTDDHTFDIELDYTLPAYRDCSVGTYLYNYLTKEHAISKFTFNKECLNHESYLINMGFESSENGYVKKAGD